MLFPFRCMAIQVPPIQPLRHSLQPRQPQPRRTLAWRLLSSAALAVSLGAPTLVARAQPAAPAASPEASPSWMREYVRLRVARRNLDALSQAAGRSASDASVRELFSPRIVGGSPALASDNPFQVALLQANVANNQAAQFCGGTLLRERFVVTAAHCSDFVTANQVQVLTGSRSLTTGGTRRNVARIVIHPRWNSNTFDYDVAVWELNPAASGSPPVSLATTDGAVGTPLLATGWGAVGEGQGGSAGLRRVQVPLVEQANCNDANSYNGAITDRMLCAGRDQGGIDTCQGDSGGPLTNGGVLTGIVSWGTGCARPNLFGIYARVSNPAIRDFIINTIEVPVSCQVFNDGNTSQSGLSDAIYVRNNSTICTPDGTPTGRCRKWFGLCRTSEPTPQPVRFRVFNDANTNQTAPSDAVYPNAPNVSCIPDGTARGNCRRWFGLPVTADGRPTVCRLFNDGYTNITGPTTAIYYRAPGSVCMPDGTATGTCRKWFGRCTAQ